MNPFDLPGPQFLLFYAGFALLVLVGLWLARRMLEGGEVPAVELNDACQLAYLRGGPLAAVDVGLFSLVDRGILRVAGRQLSQVAANAGEALQRPFERALFIANLIDTPGFATPKSPRVRRAELTAAADRAYRGRLEALGLLPDDAALRRRNLIAGVGIALVLIVAGVKLAVALERGRSNVEFLIVLAVAVAAACLLVRRGSHTRRGRAFLATLRQLLQQLRGRARRMRAGGATNEAALLAAVFGMQAVQSQVPAMLPARRRQQEEAG